MGKRLFWIFILTITVIITVAVVYVQSESFARIAKDKLQAAVARDLGIEMNFDHLGIGVLPPSLSLVNVDVKVQNRVNPLGLATDTVLKAERLGFSFRLFQAFSRGIAVNKVFWSNGEVRFAVPPSHGKKEKQKLSELVHKPIYLELGNGFSISVRQLEVRDTKLDLSWREDEKANRLQIGKISYLAVTPARSGTNLVLNLEDIDLQVGKIHEKLKTVRGDSDISRSLVQLTTLDIQRHEAALHASGKLTGSIDTPEQLKPELSVILRSPLTELADFDKNLSSFTGDLLADVKVAGKFSDPAVQGKIELTHFQHSFWSVEKLEAEGAYGNGELSLSSLEVAENSGKISLVNQVEMAFPLKPEEVPIQLRLTNARYEDFAGDVKKEVNNLKFMMDGTVGLRLDFAQDAGKVKFAGLGVKPDLRVKNFELNNQTFNKPRPYRQIFHVEPFQVSGNLNLKGGQLTIQDAKIALASGSLAVKGGVGSKGFDITGTTDGVNMGREVGTISGNPLTGEGSAVIHVHGPGDNVLIDFDLKQKNASFARFDFGEVEGRLTYDDHNDQLRIQDMHGRKNSAVYLANGHVDVGKSDALVLDASFEESDPNDLFAIFKEPLKKVSWLPWGMTGTVKGSAKVGGGYDRGLESLQIDADFQGHNWSYKGEMLHEVDAHASLDQGVLKAKLNKALKYDAPINGSIEYKLANDEMQYSLSVPKGRLRTLDFLTASGVPVDGAFSFSSEGKGKWETLVSKTRFEVQNGLMRSRPLPPLLITYDTSADYSDFHLTAVPGIEAKARVSNTKNGISTAHVQMSQANLDYFLCAVSRRNCADGDLVFNATGEGQFDWKGGDWHHLNGRGSLTSLHLEKSGYASSLSAPATFTLTEGFLDVPRFHLEGPDTKLGVKLAGRVGGTELNNHLDGYASLRLLEFVAPFVEEGRGKVDLALGLTGDASEGKFSGSATLGNGFLRLSGLDAPIDAITGKIRVEDSRFNVDGLSAQLGGGPAQISGFADLYLNRPPRFDLQLLLSNNRVKFYPVSFAEISDAKLSFAGDKPPYLLSGNVKLKRVSMRNNFDVGDKKGLKNARYLPEKVAGAKSFYEIRIRAVADNGVTVVNNLLDAEFKGEVTLMNNFEFPQILARAELVHGKLLFRSTAFTLDHAYIRAPNADYFNPQFSVGGTANVDNYAISIFADGTLDKPKITLSSSPALSQEDIVSLLAFGYKGEDVKRLNPNDTSAITYSEVGSILLDQLNLNQNLASKGVKVTVAPTFNEEEAIINRDATTQAAPEVFLQSQIAKNLEASFGGTVGSNQGQALDAKLEYRLNQRTSINGVYQQIPTGLDATETRTSYGGDLKFRWGFK